MVVPKHLVHPSAPRRDGAALRLVSKPGAGTEPFDIRQVLEDRPGTSSLLMGSTVRDATRSDPLESLHALAARCKENGDYTSLRLAAIMGSPEIGVAAVELLSIAKASSEDFVDIAMNADFEEVALAGFRAGYSLFSEKDVKFILSGIRYGCALRKEYARISGSGAKPTIAETEEMTSVLPKPVGILDRVLGFFGI